MVKVKLLVSRSGADGAFSAGDVIEVSADEAKRMAAAGQCELASQRECADREPGKDA